MQLTLNQPFGNMGNTYSFKSITLLLCMLCFSSFAQINKAKLERLTEEGMFDKLIVTFQQPQYAPGDTAHFVAYLLDQQGLTKKERTIFEFGLVNRFGEKLLNERFLFEDGLLVGRINLPLSLPPDIYTLVCTNEKFLGDKAGINPDHRFVFPVAGENVLYLEIPRVSLLPVDKPLAQGLTNQLFVQTKLGKDSIEILDESGNVVQKEASEGVLTKIHFKPQLNAKYYLKAGLGKIPITTTARPVSILTEHVNSQLEITLYKPSTESLANRFALVQNFEMLQNREINWKNDSSIVSIPWNSLRPGILDILIFDKQGKLLESTQTYLPNNSPFSEAETDITVQIDEKRRGKGSWTLGAYAPHLFRGTVHLIDTSSFTNTVPPQSLRIRKNILSELALDYSISRSLDSLTNKELIAYVESQDKRIRWETLDNSTNPDKIFNNNLPFFTGKVINKSTGKPYSYPVKITFYLSNSKLVYALNTSSDGAFSFPLFTLFQDENIFYRVFDESKDLSTNSHIELPNYTGEKPSFNRITNDLVKDKYYSFTMKKRQIDFAYSYSASNEENIAIQASAHGIVEEDCDLIIHFDEYELFPSIPQMITEIVPAIKYKYQESGSSVSVFMKQQAMWAKNAPVYLIDGIMTDSTDLFLSINPKDIKTLGLIRSNEKLRKYGDIGANGIIILESKGGDYASKVKEVSKNLLIKGVSKSSDYSSAPTNEPPLSERTPFLSALPYYRLFNTPGQLPLTGTLQLPDNIGKYVFQLEGILEDGTLVEYKLPAENRQ